MLVHMSLVTVIASGNMASNFSMDLLDVFDEIICFSTRSRFNMLWSKISRQVWTNTRGCFKW